MGPHPPALFRGEVQPKTPSIRGSVVAATANYQRPSGQKKCIIGSSWAMCVTIKAGLIMSLPGKFYNTILFLHL